MCKMLVKWHVMMILMTVCGRRQPSAAMFCLNSYLFWLIYLWLWMTSCGIRYRNSKCKLLWVYICCVVFANKIMYSTFSYKKKKMRVENGSYRIMQGSKNYNIKSDTDSCSIPQKCNQYLVRQSDRISRYRLRLTLNVYETLRPCQMSIACDLERDQFANSK